MTFNKDDMWIRKGASTFEFDYRFKSGSGVLMGIKISNRDVSTNLPDIVVRRLQAHLMHAMLRHPSNKHAEATCARIGINLTGSFPVCESCAHGKMK